MLSSKNTKDLSRNKYFEILFSFKEERAQKFTSVVLTLIAISILGLFAINPTLSTIAKLKKELSDSELIDNKLQEKITNLSILQQKYSALQIDIPDILDSIPKTPDIPLLMAQIQSIGQDSSIYINSLQNFQVELFRQNGASKKYSSYSFLLSGTGSYESISSFMSKIINMQRIISIDTFSISKTADKTGFLGFTLRGLAHYKE